MKQVSFTVSAKDRSKIATLAVRAVTMAKKYGIPDYDKQGAQMDLTATHANGCKLDLDKLLSADDFNFGHDVFGIYRHLDRGTGKLLNCFVPRCASADREEHPRMPLRKARAIRARREMTREDHA